MGRVGGLEGNDLQTSVDQEGRSSEVSKSCTYFRSWREHVTISAEKWRLCLVWHDVVCVVREFEVA